MKRILVVLLVLALMLPGFGMAEDAPKAGGVLKIASGNVTQIGSPPHVATYMEQQAVSPALETLARYGEGGRLVPWLASEWTLDPDGLEMTITLREGVKFHDGTAFDAEAVKWNLEYFKASGRNEISAVETIDVTDATHLTLHMSSWSSSIDENVLYTAGLMISPTFAQNSDEDTLFATPVGTGPFRFVRWDRGEKLVYEKNDEYWIEGKPYLDGVEMHFFSDANTTATALMTGVIDACVTGDTTVDEIMLGNGWTPVNGALPTSGLMRGVFFCSNDPEDPFYDIRVRQAFCYAMDVPTIASMYAKSGIATYTNQWNIPGSWAYNDETVGYPYDPAKAKELLAEAGYAGGVEINYYYNANSTLFAQVGQVMQAYAAQVGITLNLNPIAQALQDEMVGLNGKWDGIMEWAAQGKPYCAQLYARAFQEGGPRFSGSSLKPDDVLDLIEQGITAKTQAESEPILKELSRKIIDDYCLLLPFCVGTNCMYASRDVMDHHLAEFSGSQWTPEDCWLNR
ncbi:MAG: ABC transporter substrate-binding protein [Christensenellaceae bacterium]|nr:ABC transporter substrate-binding protein [Christensenellaceae bacterium]